MMEYSLGSILLVALCACVGPYVLWKLEEGIRCLMIRRRTKHDYESRGGSICRWGFNSKGELIHIRTERLPKD